METRRRAFINFSARIDPETNARRERIERLWDATAPQLLEKVFRLAEDQILSGFNKDQREAYFGGDLGGNGRR
jgi:hypothetical protein